MKIARILPTCLILVSLLAPRGHAQESSKPPESQKALTPLKIQVVFNEFEGERKVSSLPYVFFMNADETSRGRETSLRMGLRVPVRVQSQDKDQTQYMDVGSSLDCWASALEAGRFKLELRLDRSSVYAASPESKSAEWRPGDAPLSSLPIVRTFRSSMNLVLRDGQALESVLAADPVSGRVLKVEVTLNVVK